MPVQLAKLTLAAIDAAIEADQGAKFRQFLQKVLPHMSDAYRGEEDGFRSHLGASIIGDKCPRAIWYNFRWAEKARFPGRIIRLFNRGHLEEARFIAMLLTIDAQVYQQDANGKQYRISDVAGHFGGSGDGVVVGIPDLPPGVAAVTEWKTHNDQSYKALVKVGVREAKFVHFVQMQVYMLKMGITWSLYGAANKNDDHIHLELIQLDVAFAEQFIDRARQIIPRRDPPDKINKSAGWFDCKWCNHRPVCHLGEVPHRNCRTCKFSEVDAVKGGWHCGNEDRKMKMLFGPKPGISEEGEVFELSEKRQMVGCDLYERLF